MNLNRSGSFRRGLLTSRFLSETRHHVTPKDLKDHLEDHGEVVTIRSCQRYLLEVEAIQPVNRGGRYAKPEPTAN